MKTPQQWLDYIKILPAISENSLLVIIKLIQEDASKKIEEDKEKGETP